MCVCWCFLCIYFKSSLKTQEVHEVSEYHHQRHRSLPETETKFVIPRARVREKSALDSKRTELQNKASDGVERNPK